jgi:hypothetical protein
MTLTKSKLRDEGAGAKSPRDPSFNMALPAAGKDF